MADSRHLEKSKMRHISATDWPISMKFGRLTQIGLPSVSAGKNLNFWKSKMAATAILENGKIAISPQLFDRFHEISHGDAHWHSLCQRAFKIAILKIQHGGQPPSWKIENAPYLSNGLADIDGIWQAYPDWVCQAYKPVKNWIFENPRWRRPPFWKR